VRLQLPPTYQRLSVGHLEDPRTRGTLRPIEEFAPPVNVEEDLLNEIVSLSTVPERPLANGTDQPGVTPEEYGKSVLLSSGHHAYKRFIGGLNRGCWHLGRDGRSRRSVWGHR
jgi:hypothetical protein